MDLRKLRALQYVDRFSVERVNRKQSVAEHSFGVALLALEASQLLPPQTPEMLPPYSLGELLRAALLHDAPEAVLGDIPYYVRLAIPAPVLAELEGKAESELDVPSLGSCSNEVQEIVAFCDTLELAQYLSEESSSGNESLFAVYEETLGRLGRSPLWGALGGWAMDLLGIDCSEEPRIRELVGRLFRGLKH